LRRGFYPPRAHADASSPIPRTHLQVKRRRYFENTQDIKKRKQSARFKKVFRPRTGDASESIALGKPKGPGAGAAAAGAAAPATPTVAAP
jgi:hypothetical protein